MLKKILTISLVSLFAIKAFSLDFGYTIFQNYSFVKKTEYTPAVYISHTSNYFLTFQLTSQNSFFSASPALSLKNENIFFNFYRFKLDFLFDKAVFSLSKDIYSMGSGYIYNPIIPQSISLKINDSTEWYSKVDFYLNEHIISLGTLIDSNIDYYEIPQYINPYFYYAFNSISNMVGLCVDYDYKFGNFDNSKLKFALDTQFFLKKDYSLYFAGSLSSNFSQKTNYSILASVDKSIFIKNLIFIPKFEFLFQDTIFSAGFNINMDFSSYLNNLFFIKYSTKNELKIMNKISFTVNKFKFEMSYMINNILKKSFTEGGVLILGVIYE
ncbi:MAG: hypothetical protein ACTTJ7_00255 [Treponema sp.]